MTADGLLDVDPCIGEVGDQICDDSAGIHDLLRGFHCDLDMLREENPNIRIFLVVEPCDPSAPDHDIRVRRQDFYRRNGCINTGIQVISDDEWFDTMFVQGELSEKEMVDLVKLYEDIHNGRQ